MCVGYTYVKANGTACTFVVRMRQAIIDRQVPVKNEKFVWKPKISETQWEMLEINVELLIMGKAAYGKYLYK